MQKLSAVSQIRFRFPPLQWDPLIVQYNTSGRGGATTLRLDTIAPGVPLAAFNTWCTTLPHYATADYRGIAYMVFNNAGVDIAVGFLHNIYSVTDGRSVIVQRLADAADLIINQDPAQPDIVYIGGDFNVAAAIRRNRARITMTPLFHGSIAYSAPPPPPTTDMLTAAQDGMAGAHAGGTLLSGNLYDYWYWNGPLNPMPAGYLNPPIANIDTRTCERAGNVAVPGTNGRLSDHMASWLNM